MIVKHYLKDGNSGFTIIELLIFMTISGLLSSVSLPKFLTQSQKAKQAEAKNFVGKMNRAQQAYYLEHNNVFANNAHFKDLGVGMQTQTQNYIYSITGGGNGTPVVTSQAILKQVKSPLKSYVGGVSATLQPRTNNIVIQSILCEAAKSGISGGVTTGVVQYSVIGPPSCPVNMIVIK
jgi:type IV pilus assembly protein PilA